MKSLSKIGTPIFRMTSFILGFVLAATLVVIFAAKAVHNTTPVFELGPLHDGPQNANIVDNQDGYPDWTELFTVNQDGTVEEDTAAVQSFGGLAATFLQDDLSAKGATDRTIFAQSNKNNDLISTWNWDSGNNPPKDDISNTYAYATMVGEEMYIYIGLERLAPEGDSHVDFEFNQQGIGLDKDPACGTDLTGGPQDGPPCEFTGDKTIGDLLVVMDFLNGGKLGFVEIRTWNGTEYALVEKLDGEGCDATDDACAFNNALEIATEPWASYDRHGNTVTKLPPNAFTEVGVNVTGLLGTNPCFNTFQAKTRTSGSFNSELKDFAAGAFALCRAEVVTEIHAGDDHENDIQGGSVLVGTLIHDKAIVTGQGGIPNLPDPTGTVTFTLYDNLTCNGTVLSQEDVTLVGEGGGVASAESSDFDTTAKSGFYSYGVSYSGDEHYPPAEAEHCEEITVLKRDSEMLTQVHALIDGNAHVNVTFGTIDALTLVHDYAQVSDDSGVVPALTPTGNVEFRLFLDTGCTNEFIGTIPGGDTYPLTKALSGGEAETASFAMPVGGRGWLVSYDGDANFNGSSHDCEPVTGQALDSVTETFIHEGAPDPTHTPTNPADLLGETVQVGTTIHDMARVSAFNTGAPTPGGSVNFFLYDNHDCNAEGENNLIASYLGIALSDDGLAETPAYTITSLGTGKLAYRAEYNGDDPDNLFNDSVGPCETLNVELNPSSIVTEVHDAAHTVVSYDVTNQVVTVGTVIHDWAKVTGGGLAPFDPTGTVTFLFWENLNCSGDPAQTISADLLADGTNDGMATTETLNAAVPFSVTTTSGQELSFRASYGGNGVYAASSDSRCEPLKVEVVGNEGCTPGYWRNHLDRWLETDYSTTDDFDTVFGVNLFNPNITLGQAINLGGGGNNALARHGTAALLSASHPDVNFPYSVAQVIALVQAGDTASLSAANELGCPID